MIIGIGCDMVDHGMSRSLGWDTTIFDQLSRIFTPEELAEANNHDILMFLSGRFAIKEAVVKSLRSGMEDGIALNEIQILRNENGGLSLKVFGGIKRFSEKLKINKWHISISQSVTLSFAIVIAESLES